MGTPIELKALAIHALERLRKKPIPLPESVSHADFDEAKPTKENNDLIHALIQQKSFIVESYLEREAIVQFDGGQQSSLAKRIAYQDAFISTLISLPYDEPIIERDGIWLRVRIRLTLEWLETLALRNIN